MKHLLLIVNLAFLIMSNINCIPAQNREEQTINMIREFYSAYITEIASSLPPRLVAEKLDSIQKVYCSDKLLKEVPDIMEKTEADAFLKAQDSDLKSLETLTIDQDSTNLNGYIVSYFDTYSQKLITIRLTVIKEKGKFKIDAIR